MSTKPQECSDWSPSKLADTIQRALNGQATAEMRMDGRAAVAVMLGRLTGSATRPAQNKTRQTLTLQTVPMYVTPETPGEILEVVVTQPDPHAIEITVENYGTYDAAPGDGAVILLELGPQLRVIAFDDLLRQDPTILDMAPAHESQRATLSAQDRYVDYRIEEHDGVFHLQAVRGSGDFDVLSKCTSRHMAECIYSGLTGRLYPSTEAVSS